ncbi:hypothetical protein STSP2_01565 [Anaerohalosphaera lusitana]|uniref:Uncharacterized protein n=1 Tax=Anaerohalosphaera lusitana TaxID=1936003 RepID=A0A1U9NKR6_9BACT|nr:hypothetical protein [Anaerohalosphaera lusitana]AQT68405.1 hypothetical protein STSP2_01565 [Anaerohalosphaera lusitana]
MNRTHQLAKLALALIGIYFIVLAVPTPITYIMVIISGGAADSANILQIFIGTLIYLGYMYLLYFLLIRKRACFAEKIVPEADQSEPGSPSQWIPLVYRLTCISVGIYLSALVITNITSIINNWILHRQIPDGVYSAPNSYSSIFLIPLAAYLLAGAPHFVRWQTRKTLEFCKTQEQ